MSLSARNSMALVVVLALAGSVEALDLELKVKPGTPLQIQIDSKTPIRKGQRVRGTLVHAVHVFDREVLPAGTIVLGGINQVNPAPKLERAQSYLSGRVRTGKVALIAFDEILLSGGRRLPLSTSVTLGYPAVMRVTSLPKPGKHGVVQTANGRIGGAVASHEIVRMVRAVERPAGQTRLAMVTGAARKVAGETAKGLKHEVLSYWPFGQQYVSRGTSFTAVLQQTLDLGSAPIDAATLESLGSTPPPDTVIHARLIDQVSSARAQAGSPVRAVTTRPVFSPDGQLVLPEGTGILGEVTQATPARRLGRNGRLQIRFTKIDSTSAPALAVSGTLEAVEVDGTQGMQIDAEGAAGIPVSKKRFIAPAIAMALSTNAVPDADDAFKAQGGAPGWSGFGLVGAAASMATYKVAGPLGWWGSASSIYFNLIRKARELEFPANTVIEIRLGRSPVASPNLLTR